MPHVIIKYFDAPISEARKGALAVAITQALVENLGCLPRVVSVAMRPVDPADWNEKVFVPDISHRRAELIKEPDY